MRKKFGGIVGALMEWERQTDAAKAVAEGRPICTGCGWSCDDPEFDLCCDCFDEITMKQMLRGEWGKAEQAEARAAVAR